VLIVFIMLSCLGLLSCIELAFFRVVQMVLFVSTLAKWYLLCRRVSPTKTRLKSYLF